MSCYCGHFFFQMCDSTCETVPPDNRWVIVIERGSFPHVGRFHAASGWWSVLSRERVDGTPMPQGDFCSISIGRITGWRPIA